MSLHPSLVEPVPEQTAQIAHTAFPKGSPYLTLRDELGTLYLTMIFQRSFLSAANRRSRRGVWHSPPFSNFAKVSRTARPPKPCALASIGNICWGLSGSRLRLFRTLRVSRAPHCRQGRKAKESECYRSNYRITFTTTVHCPRRWRCP